MLKRPTVRPIAALVVIALLMAIAYLALMPSVSWPLYEFALLRPDRAGPKATNDKDVVARDYKAALEEITFTAPDGAILHGRFIRLTGVKRVFLACEGRGGNIYHRLNHAEFLLQCGGSVMQYDYEGYGLSEGSPSVAKAIQDGLAAYDYLVMQKHILPEQIIVYGESFGTGAAGQIAAQKPVGGVILHSGFSSLWRAGKDTYPWLKLYPAPCFPKELMDNIPIFQNHHAPLLIMHGGRDGTISLQNAQELYAAATPRKALLVVPRGGHSFFAMKLTKLLQIF